jgi:hypothetical protein
MLPFHIGGFHDELLFFKNVLMKLCASNYATLDGLVNGVDGHFSIWYKKKFKTVDLDIFS